MTVDNLFLTTVLLLATIIAVGLAGAAVAYWRRYFTAEGRRRRDLWTYRKLSRQHHASRAHVPPLQPNAYLRGADLRGAKLRHARLQGADLQDANLQGADLQDVNLRHAKLRDADLRDAKLQGARLVGADLQGANLAGTILEDSEL